MSEPLVVVEVRGRVGLLKLNRPKALNALSNEVVDELAEAVSRFEADDNIGAMVLTGSQKAFRSEEHTSELQSLMRISYAVFCLKKKTNNPNINKIQTYT